MSSERTKPRYPTFGPADGTGRDWHQYFEDLRASRPGAPPVEGDDDDPVEPITVTVPAREVAEADLAGSAPRALLTWRNRLLANDWRYKVGNCLAHHEATYTKAGAVKREEHDEEVWWINAIKDGEYITITYTMIDGKTYRSSRSVRGRWGLLGDKELKELVENE